MFGKLQRFRKMPTTLEYFSYVFHFQALMAGPVIFYRDYIDFIHGSGIRGTKPLAVITWITHGSFRNSVRNFFKKVDFFKNLIFIDFFISNRSVRFLKAARKNNLNVIFPFLCRYFTINRRNSWTKLFWNHHWR